MTYTEMKNYVPLKLASMANKEEDFYQFIRSSEKEFGLPEADVFSMSPNQLNSYIDELSYLWDK